ncbi:MAG TPA: CPBP family intramembrane glutamic endopeptidase [Thermomicrobiales bacterium]|nr:CPBP family intramembrane glutamic endopeptidase [Thermomicrobiales bacterium]
MHTMTPDPPNGGGLTELSPARVPTVAQVALFLALTFGATWALFLPLVLGVFRRGMGAGVPLEAFGILAPTGLAFILTALTAGRGGVRRLWRLGGRWRVGAGWYAFVLVGPGLAVGVSLAVAAGLGGPAAPASLSVDAALAAVISGLLAGTFEEFGWSGFAFPGLHARFGVLWAGAAMGVAVAVWHIPFFLVPGTTQSSSSFAFFLVQLLPARILFGWIVAGTGGSVLLAILFHASWNAWTEFLGSGPMVADAAGVTQTAILGVAAATVLLLNRGPALRTAART